MCLLSVFFWCHGLVCLCVPVWMKGKPQYDLVLETTGMKAAGGCYFDSIAPTAHSTELFMNDATISWGF